VIGPADTASSRFLSADSLATNVRDEAASCFRAATRLAPLVPTILLELTFFDQRERRPVLGNVASAKELSQISAIRPHDFFCDHRCRGLTHGQCYKTWPAGSRRRRPRRLRVPHSTTGAHPNSTRCWSPTGLRTRRPTYWRKTSAFLPRHSTRFRFTICEFSRERNPDLLHMTRRRSGREACRRILSYSRSVA
jgi:hypothetical protein